MSDNREDMIRTLDSFDSERFLVFTLSGEEYAIPLLKVKEVIGLTDVTPLPFTPSYFLGIMNLRGQVISVIDLRLKFNMKQTEATRETTIIILDMEPVSLGVVVDSVDSVLAASASDVKPPPDVESTIGGDCISGVTKREENLVLIVDIEKAINAEDLKIINKNRGSQAA